MLNMRNHPPKAENFRMVATSGDSVAAVRHPDRTRGAARASGVSSGDQRKARRSPAALFANGERRTNVSQCTSVLTMG